MRCSLCGVDVETTVTRFRSEKTGCLCAHGTEKSVFNFVMHVLDEILPDKSMTVTSQYTRDDVRGRCNRLKFDIAVKRDKVPVLFIEVDGGHHFDPLFTYRPSALPSNAMQYDIVKEEAAIRLGVPMLRICTATVRNGATRWDLWIQSAIELVANQSLPAEVYRKSMYDLYAPEKEYGKLRMNHPRLSKSATFPLIDVRERTFCPIPRLADLFD
jgi:hypothetical protein